MLNGFFPSFGMLFATFKMAGKDIMLLTIVKK